MSLETEIRELREAVIQLKEVVTTLIKISQKKCRNCGGGGRAQTYPGGSWGTCDACNGKGY